jgi:hypothetical protein
VCRPRPTPFPCPSAQGARPTLRVSLTRMPLAARPQIRALLAGVDHGHHVWRFMHRHFFNAPCSTSQIESNRRTLACAPMANGTFSFSSDGTLTPDGNGTSSTSAPPHSCFASYRCGGTSHLQPPSLSSGRFPVGAITTAAAIAVANTATPFALPFASAHHAATFAPAPSLTTADTTAGLPRGYAPRHNRQRRRRVLHSVRSR